MADVTSPLGGEPFGPADAGDVSCSARRRRVRRSRRARARKPCRSAPVYRGREGEPAGDDLVTHVAFSHHPAVHALAQAMGQAGTTAAGPARAAFDGLRLEVATGTLTLGSDGYATMPMYVARATRHGLEVA